MILTALAALALLAALAPSLCAKTPRLGGAIIAAVPFALGLWIASNAAPVFEGGSVIETLEWLPKLGVDLAFRVDGL
ncbi:MAG: hypothetical protein AAGF47_00575, partial [Planctomycetota bacterium]